MTTALIQTRIKRDYSNAVYVRISLEGLDSKIWKVSRCRPAVSNETILATKQEFFLTKIAPAQSITDIALLRFWLILLPWMFISSYFTIYFFVKDFFFRMFIFQWIRYSDVLICFWLRKGHPLSTYATGEMERGHPKYVQVRTGGGVLKNRSLETYALNRWPQKNFVKYFLALLWPSTLEHHRQQGKCHCFLPSKLRSFYPMR